MGTESFQVSKVALADVRVGESTFHYEYNVDGTVNNLSFDYGDINLRDAFQGDEDRLYAYAVSLGVMCMGKFGAVIPKELDVTKFSPWVHPNVLAFLRDVLPKHWSEHRYQLSRLDFAEIQFLVDEDALAAKVTLPLAKIDEGAAQRVLVATGSGKDSLLCESILKAAGIDYEPFTYLYDLYGGLDHQDKVFNRIAGSFSNRVSNTIRICDDYEPWLQERMASFGGVDALVDKKLDKPFRIESGEVYFGSFAMIPIQIARGAPIQAFGMERSADFKNLADKETGEAVMHQFAKSFPSEHRMHQFYEQMFENIWRVSLTKPIYDVKIFTTLFSLAGETPYLTNSCNFTKPWCRKCEKCSYVFAGFVAYGDHQKTVEGFGGDIFNDREVLPVWADLLGLKDRIAWECVGNPEETQFYFYKALKKGVQGHAIDLFATEVLQPLRDRGFDDDRIDKHFQDIEAKYLVVDPAHHHMPDWLAAQVLDVLNPS